MRKITFILLIFYTGIILAQEANYTIENINTNTKYSDFGVTYYGEDEAVFASSRTLKAGKAEIWYGNKEPFLELFIGKLIDNGEIQDIRHFSKKINSKYHESNVSFTKDLKTVYFSRNNYIKGKSTKSKKGINLIQLYRAEITETGEWINITPMPFNSRNHQTGHPVLNKDETKLYFTSDMAGSIGGTDIFVVDVNEDGTYGEPQNLGSKVNTRGKEMFPFIDENDVLYFSSNGFIDGRGGLDVYAISIPDLDKDTKAVNLGYPINSKWDDFNLVYRSGIREGHFSSNREGGKGNDDIYYFKEQVPLELNCSQSVKGVVRERVSKRIIPGATVDLYNSKGEVIQTVIADNLARFNFNVDCSASYKVVGSKTDYTEDTEYFVTNYDADLELSLGLNLVESEFVRIRGLLMIAINPIYFDLDKSFIRTDAAIELEKVVTIMTKYPGIKVDLRSHTDSRAPDDYNWKLSDRRAKSSIAWLIKRGIDASRITGRGYGETELTNRCSNDVKCSEAEHQLNRRTEFVILNPEMIK